MGCVDDGVVGGEGVDFGGDGGEGVDVCVDVGEGGVCGCLWRWR